MLVLSVEYSIYEERFRQRFWAKVDPTKDCNAWTAGKDAEGYGRISYHSKNVLAHRAVWYLIYGYWSIYLLHTCDTPGCVNIKHLREGTHQDNMDDRDAKGRNINLKGEMHGSAKLTDVQVQEIRSLRGNGLLQREVGEIFGVSGRQIGNIWSGKQRGNI